MTITQSEALQMALDAGVGLTPYESSYGASIEQIARLVELAYARGLEDALRECKDVHMQQSINNQEYSRTWHDGVGCCVIALQELKEHHERPRIA